MGKGQNILQFFAQGQDRSKVQIGLNSGREPETGERIPYRQSKFAME
jgi:hypothetical protein